MSNNNNKRPPAWNIFARRDYDSRRRHYNDFLARVLPPDEADRYDIFIPPQWRNVPEFITRLMGGRGKAPSTGVGFVHSPYADLYTKVYGVTPIADLPEYRLMYRTQPDIKQAIDLQVNLAVSRGLTIRHKKKRVAKYLAEVADRIDLIENLQIVARDMLTYGDAFLELLWEEREFTDADVTIDNQNITMQRVSKNVTSDIAGLKPLDPTYMRARRDAYGAVFGYIQWMAYPPVLLDTDVCIQFKNNPNSQGYESEIGRAHV